MTDVYEQLVDHAPVGLLTISLGGVILAYNRRMATWLHEHNGAETDTFVGRNIVDWLTPSTRMLYETRVMPQILSTGSVREAVIEIKGPDGSRVPFLMNAEVAEGDGETHLRAALLAAPGRIAFEREVVQARHDAEVASEALSLMQDATSKLAVAQGVDDLGEVLVEAAGRATHAAWTSVRIEETVADGMSTVMRQWGTAPAGALHEEPFVTEQFVSRSVEELTLMVPEHGLPLIAAGVESLVLTPIIDVREDETRVIGEISCWFRRPRTLEPQVLHTLESLAVQAELVLDHLALQDRIRHRALHDGLTGLANRILLEEQLEQILSQSRRNQQACAVLFLDLDGFKKINDQLGHAVGDEVLITVADRLRATCRSGEVVSRLGGDEFVIAAADLDEEGAAQLAERVWQVVRAPLEGSAAGMPLSSSVGVMTWDPASDAPTPTSSSLLAAADAAMYEVKRTGRDAVFIRAWQG